MNCPDSFGSKNTGARDVLTPAVAGNANEVSIYYHSAIRQNGNSILVADQVNIA